MASLKKNEIHFCIITLGSSAVLCDAVLANDLTENLFNPVQLEKTGLLIGKARGRGDAWFIKYRGHNWVLRHFRRGGLVGRLIEDRYFGWDLERSRAWAEWRLLAELYRRGLPVPRPVAAAVSRHFGFYRADLITELIPDSQPLADWLTVSPQSEDFWKKLGICLRRFHDQDVYHVDLNARNILIDACSQIYLIDFDRGSIRPHGAWKNNNLQRLKRSLLKLKRNSSNCHFEEADWDLLIRGYEI